MNRFIDRFKKFISKFTDIPIYKGTGITIPEEKQKPLFIPDDKDFNSKGIPLSKLSGKVELRTHLNKFEVIGTAAFSTGSMYKLRHVDSDTIVYITVPEFKFLFRKVK